MIEALILWKVWDIHSELRDPDPFIGVIAISVLLQLFIWPVSLTVTLSRTMTWPLTLVIVIPVLALCLLVPPIYFVLGLVAAALLTWKILDIIN